MELDTKLGQHASTILTNRSGYVTVVSESPYTERQRTDFDSSFSRHGRYLRGSRPMHKNTFCFEKNPKQMDYETSTRKTYSGKAELPHGIRPPRCQSLHRSHFFIGTSYELDLSTQNMKSFNKKQVQPANKVHEDRARWNDQMMAGKSMNESLRHEAYKQLNRETSYGLVHDALAKTLPNGLPRIRNATDRFNIISGAYVGPAEEKCHKMKSGNRVLQKIRMDSVEGLLG